MWPSNRQLINSIEWPCSELTAVRVTFESSGVFSTGCIRFNRDHSESLVMEMPIIAVKDVWRLG